MKNTRLTGDEGERLAAACYERDGYRILCRNYKGAHGEIDIIAEKDAYIVFAEVKRRRMLSQKPIEAVNPEKLGRITETAREFLCEYADNAYIASLKVRFDAVEILSEDGKPCTVRRVEGIRPTEKKDFYELF